MTCTPSTLLLVAALCAAPLAQAGTLDDLRERGTIRLGYSESKAPFSFKARHDGQPAGFSVERCKRVAAAAARSLGAPSMRLEWVPLDPDGRLEAVASGHIDLECGTTTATLSRRRQVDFSLPIFVDGATLMGRASVATRIPDLQGRRIAVAESTTTVQALQRGLALFEESLSYEPYALALRRGDTEFRLLVDAALAETYRTGDIDSIAKSWLAPLGTPSPALVALYLLNALPE